jgi:hypothetical protein
MKTLARPLSEFIGRLIERRGVGLTDIELEE